MKTTGSQLILPILSKSFLLPLAVFARQHRHHFLPSRFKKTKSMAALLNERSKHPKSNTRSDHPVHSQSPTEQNGRSLQSLVESVKRKSSVIDHDGLGKRRKLRKS
jgi:hypothetical protein